MSESRNFVLGLGRRKTAVARVRIRSGSGVYTINDRAGDEYFPSPIQRSNLRKPFDVVELAGKFDVFARVAGGGPVSQSEAVRLGIARALCRVNKDLEPKLKEFSLLTRDSRMKERKKYGKRGARRGTQFSKR